MPSVFVLAHQSGRVSWVITVMASHEQTLQQTTEIKLTREEQIALKNRRNGVTIFQVSWIMAFVCLTVVNLQIRWNFPSWPPEGVAALDRVLPTIVTIGLIVSMWSARQGLKVLQVGNYQKFTRHWKLSIGLGIAFILGMAFQWITADVGSQYNTIFRLMVAFHGFHAFVILIWMATVKLDAEGASTDEAPIYNPIKHWKIEASVRLWDFVVVAWLMFYVVLYIL